MRLSLFFGLALAVGCQQADFSELDSSDSSSNCGHFEGDVVASWDNDGRKMTLREDFGYVDPDGRRWTAPAGSVVDGASIPAAFWTFIGGPFEGQYRKASVVHDVGCQEMSSSWEDVHRMFYDACVCGGVDVQTAKVLYYAVYHFGPRWEPVDETVVETHQDAQGQLVQQQVRRRHMRRTNPTPPTSDEVQQVVELIQDENPAPAVLEETTREVLRRRPRRGRNYNRGNPAGKQYDNSIARFTDNQSSGQLAIPPIDSNTADTPSSPPRATERMTFQDRPPTDQQNGQRYHGRSVRSRDQSPDQNITEQEKQWVAQQVNGYLVNQMRQNIPDQYQIERTQEGYRVALRYYERDQQNNPIGYSSITPTARVSRNGQVLEIR